MAFHFAARGAAQGGRLAVRLTDASMAFQTQFSLETRAIGGNALGGDGGRGGNATTGQATLLISSLRGGWKRGFEVWAGGGMGRTPFVGSVVSPFVVYEDLLAYLTTGARVSTVRKPG